jgi:hypothetical protein
MIVTKAFVLDDGGNVVSSWYTEHARATKVMARLDMRMIYLRQLPRENWVRPYYDTLRDGVGEVRFEINRINYRPLGYFGPNRDEFTFLFFCKKKSQFEPRNAIDIAASRRKLIESCRAETTIVTRWELEDKTF